MGEKILAIFLVLAALENFYCGKDSARPVKQYTIEQFLKTTRFSGSSFSADEKYILFSSDHSGIFNAYTIPSGGGEIKQITHSDSSSIFAISFFPADNRILLSGDKNGNEIDHIYLQNEDGTIRDLTPGEKVRAEFYEWSHDHTGFYFGCNQRNERFMDIYRMEIGTFRPTLVYQNNEGFTYSAISNDTKYLALLKIITDLNSDIYLYNLDSREMKNLTPHSGDINYYPVSFSVDSKNLYYLTDENNEFTYLKRLDIQSDQTEIIEQTPWDIMFAYFSYNGKYRVVGINNDARTEIKIYDTQTNQPLPLPQFPSATIASVNISEQEQLMTFYVNGSRSPDNLYIYNFKTREYKKLTEAMNPEIDQNDLVDAQVVRYKSFDGLEIPALLYKPHQIKVGDKSPALVAVHGGPGGQATISYREFYQFLVNHGYVLIDVNNRGSSGYGKTFYKLDNLKHGEDDLADCVEAKKFLAGTGYVDTSKVGIIGASYGGYMVLAALTFRPESFALGVDQFGISNWVRTLKNTPPWWEAFKEALYKEMGNPETDEAYLYGISPLFHAEKISKPLMVLQGANDPRVLKVESDEIVAAVKKKGIKVEYIVFDDEGHGFLKKQNRIKGYSAILNFLDAHLKY